MKMTKLTTNRGNIAATRGAAVARRVALVGLPALALAALGAFAWSRFRKLEARLDEQTRGRLSPAY